MTTTAQPTSPLVEYVVEMTVRGFGHTSDVITAANGQIAVRVAMRSAAMWAGVPLMHVSLDDVYRRPAALAELDVPAGPSMTWEQLLAELDAQ